MANTGNYYEQQREITDSFNECKHLNTPNDSDTCPDCGEYVIEDGDIPFGDCDYDDRPMQDRD